MTIYELIKKMGVEDMALIIFTFAKQWEGELTKRSEEEIRAKIIAVLNSKVDK